MLLFILFVLFVRLTSGSGGCDVGNLDVKNFDFYMVGFGVLT